jgi:hypothetical protein
VVNTQTAQMDDLELVAMPSAVSCAGLFVRFTLTEWSLRSLMEQAEHAVREMVAAVVAEADQESPDIIVLRLLVAGDLLMIEVRGGHSAQPQQGWFLAEQQGAVRYQLPLPTGVNASAVALPRRAARRSLISEQMTGEKVEVDPAVLERILSSLTGTQGQ